MQIFNIMNPNHKDIYSPVSLYEDEFITDIEIDMQTLADCESALVKNRNDEPVGSIRSDRLIYLLRSLGKISFIPMIDCIEEGLIAIDTDSTIFYINPAYTRLLGVPGGKIIGRKLSDVEPDAALLDVLSTQQETIVKKKYIKNVGKYISIHIRPLYQNGVFAGAFSLFSDVTEVDQLSKTVKQMSNTVEEYSRRLEQFQVMQANRMIGESPNYVSCVLKALTAARSDVTILLRGENGVGKDVLANAIKDSSMRSDKPFITVNCSAIPDALFESELFGFEEGSFTGSRKGGGIGKFQLADGGTLFLDEIGDMPLHMQVKLLRVLQSGEIEKIGSSRSISVNVRIIAATNRPLEQLIAEKKFREDLYYRLNVISVTIPPLRERGNDVILLANHFLEKYAEKYGKDARFSKTVYQIFLSHSWPGNVRELQNAIESALVLCRDNIIRADDLPEHITHGSTPDVQAPPVSRGPAFNSADADGPANAGGPINASDSEHVGNSAPADTNNHGLLKEEMDAYEKKIIEDTLARFGGSKTKTQAALGLSKRTFYRKLAYHGLTHNGASSR
jgi:transcriptional regulator with PAS, ATPase and Fis domain